jgi:hypothetical protein
MLTVSRDEINEIFDCNGRVRGVALCTDAEYLRRHEGEDALLNVQKVTQEMGHPIDYRNIKPMEWYPIGLRATSLNAIVESFNWNDEQLRKMGISAPKYSIITKMMLRYFVSVGMIVNRIQMYWNKNYTVGTIEAKLDDSSVFIRLEDCKIPRSLFPYLEGYFIGALGMVIGKQKPIFVDGINWTQGKKECCEFVIKW